MPTKYPKIPKLPQTLPKEIREWGDKMRQALELLTVEVEKDIDGQRITFGSITEQSLSAEINNDLVSVRFYIEPLTGTAIKNNTGTVTIRAVKVDGNGLTPLTAGNIKMFKPDGTLAGNGYIWTAGAADIDGEITITLRNDPGATIWDTIKLIDVTDSASFGSTILTYDDLDTTGAASTAGRYALLSDEDNNATGVVNNFQLTEALLINMTDTGAILRRTFFESVVAGDHIVFHMRDDRWYEFEVNTVEPIISGNRFKFRWDFVRSTDADPTVNHPTAAGNNVEFRFSKTTVGVIGSVDASNGLSWSRAIDGGAWTPAGTFTDLTCSFYRSGVVVATRVVRVTLNTSDGTLTTTNQSNTGEATSFGTNGEGTTSLSVNFTHTSSGANALEQVVTVQGGTSGITISIDSTNGLHWTRAVNDGAWTPAGTTTDITFTFRQAGATIATRTRRVTLNTTDGTLTEANQASSGEATTVSVLGSGTTAITIEVTHTNSSTVGGATVATSQSGDDALIFYIKPINGTAIRNGTGTLTVEAHQLTGGVDILLSAGTIQLFDPGDNIVNVANGYVAGSDGYTGILDSGDISGDIVITLKDGPAGAALDTITLVDIADGINAVGGFIEANPTLAWTQAVNDGVWTPAAASTQLDVTFIQGGVDVARVGRTINRSATGILTDGGAAVHSGGDLNTSRITPTITGASSQALTVEFAYSFGGDTSGVGETVLTSRSGDDALQFYIKPLDGTAIHNGTGTLTIEAHRITGGVDVLLSAGTIQLFDPSNNIVNVANGYVTGSDGYTGILDSGDINDDIVITLKDGTGGTPLDTVTLVDIADGADQVYGFIEAIPTLAWARNTDDVWTPTDVFSRVDVTFVLGGVEVARWARDIDRSAAGILTDGGAATHGGGNLNTSRVTVNISGASTQALTIQFDYSFSGDVASIAETLLTATAGENPVTGFLTNEAEIIPTDGNGDNGDFSNANGEFKVFEGVDDVSTSATFSEVSEVDVTGTINTAVDTPVSGEPAGYYEVTAMPSNPSNGQYNIRAVFGGVTIDKTFSLAKSFSPLGIFLSGNIQESVANGTVNPVPNSSRTATASGGTPPYDFSGSLGYVRVSGATQIIANTPNAATTTFRSTGTDTERSAVFRCDVDDDVGAGPVQSGTINIDVIHGVPP